jgi:hypothetical protein
MSEKQFKEATINFRAPISERNAFWEKASAYETPSQVLRELMRGYVDGRIVIERSVYIGSPTHGQA